MALNGLPIIGQLYIIKPDQPINNDVYDYTHFVAWRNKKEIINK